MMGMSKSFVYFKKNFNPKSQEAFVNISPNRYKPNKAKATSAAGFLFKTLKEEKEQLTIERQSLRDDYESMEEQFRDRHREHEEEIDKLNVILLM